MLNKIKEYIKFKTSNYKRDTSIDKNITELVKGDWSIGLDDINVLENELQRFVQYSEIKVLDIGSGASTLVFLRHLLKNYQFSSLDVVEQDPFWLQKMKKITDIHLMGINKVLFHLIHCDYNNTTGFDFDILNNNLSNDYDIIFVDAPPDTTITDGRYLLCMKLIPRLKVNSVLIIHDTHRNTELYAFERLSLLFRRSKTFNTRKGIAVLSFPIKI